MTPSLDALEQRLFQLETLYEIGRECARVHTVPDVLRVILSMVMGSFGAVRGIAFVGEASGRLEGVHSRGLASRGHLSEEVLAQSYLLTDGADSWRAHASMSVCLPFEVDSSSHGAIALGPRLGGAPYSDDDRALLETIVANATPHLRNVKLLQALELTADELARKVQALAVANEVALSISARPSARRLHRFLVERVASALDAVEGALGLKEGAWTVAARYLPETGENSRAEADILAGFAAAEGELTTADYEVVAPIRSGDELLSALWLRRDRRTRPFDADDRALLEFLATQAGVILETSRLLESFLVQQQEQFRLRGMLEQYLAPSVAERLIAGETRPMLEGTRLPLSVLMVDMRGSTELINHVEPETMVQVLNLYLGRMTDILFRYEGTVDKFAGDAVLGFFGAPEGHPDDAVRAVRAGAAMQREFAVLLDELRRQYTLPAALGIGVGIATGEAVVGNIGSAKRLEHTVIGPVVNLAARLTASAPAGTVQLDDATWRAVAAPLGFARGSRRRRPRRIRAKGFEGLVPVYRLHASDVLDPSRS